MANIPESEAYGVELELIALIGDRFSLDVKLTGIELEEWADYLTLGNRLLIEDVFIANSLR
ncbi:MAG: iron complex outermembrane receptor protein [Glaciecola sp.]